MELQNAEKNGMEKVAEIKPTYLEKTEGWLWEYLKNLKEFEPHVICEVQKNLDLFPLKNIHQMGKPSKINRVFGSIARSFLPRNLAVEGLMYQEIKGMTPGLIHAHFGPNGVYAIPIAKKLGLPLVTSFYGFDTSILALSQKMRKHSLPWDQLYWRNAYSKLWEYGSAFTVTCQKMKDDLVALGAPKDKIIPLHLGISLDKYQLDIGKPTIEPIILIANRFVAKKGTEYAIKAFAQVLKQFPNSTLRLIGDGVEKEKLLSLVKYLGIESSVIFLGLLGYNEYMEEMELADIFLSPSIKVSGDEEGGINTTVIEAMAVGTIVFATKESGSELIKNGVTGYMVDMGNAEDLGDKISSLIESPQKWGSIQTQARKHVEAEFDIINQARKLENIYKSLI